MIYLEAAEFLLLSAVSFFLTVSKNNQNKGRKSIIWAICAVLSLTVLALQYIESGETVFCDTALFWILYSCACIDFNEHRIPDYLSLSVAALALIKTVYSIFIEKDGIRVLWNALLGGSVVLILMLISAFVMKNGLGGGDIKLMSALGLYFGFSGLFSLLILSFLPAALFGLLLLMRRKANIKTGLPFAPFVFTGLSAAYAVSVFIQMKSQM